MLLVKGCGKSLGALFSSRFTLASSQCLSATVFCRQGLQRLRQAIYSPGLHLKVRSLNIDRERMWVLFELSTSSKWERNSCIFASWKVLGYWTAQNVWCVCICVCALHVFDSRSVVKFNWTSVQLRLLCCHSLMLCHIELDSPECGCLCGVKPCFAQHVLPACCKRGSSPARLGGLHFSLNMMFQYDDWGISYSFNRERHLGMC